MSYAPEQGLIAALDSAAARVLLDCLSGVCDQFSFARLAQAGVSAGWRCLVVNAGNGSVAHWLSEATVSRGTVTATTSTPAYLPKHPEVAVTTPEFDPATLTHGPFELVHARLPLHGPHTQGALVTALASRLTPGGVLVVESFDFRPCVLLASPEPAASEIYERYQIALLEVLAADRSPELAAIELPAAFIGAGLVGVDVAVHARSWAGGTAGAKLHVVLLAALHDRLLAAGMPADELHRLRQLLADPPTLVLGRPIFSVIGRRTRTPDVFEHLEGRP